MRTRELQIVEVLLQGSEILVEVHEAHVHQVDHVCPVVWAEVGRVEHVDVVDLVHLADVEVWNFDFRLFKAGGSWEDLLCLWSKGLWDLRVTLSHWLVLVIFNDGILNQHLGILGLSSDHDLLSWLNFFDHCFWLKVDRFVQILAFDEEVCALLLHSIRLFGFSFSRNSLGLWCLRDILCNLRYWLLLLYICSVRVRAHQILWSMTWMSDLEHWVRKRLESLLTGWAKVIIRPKRALVSNPHNRVDLAPITGIPCMNNCRLLFLLLL